MNTKKSLKEKIRKLKKTQSIQFRILATIIFAMLAITVFIGDISIYEVDKYIQGESQNFVKVTCDNEGAQINNIFEDMEKSVKVMESYIMDLFTADALVENQNFQAKVINSADQMFANVAKHASDAVAYYFRFDPAISNSKTGFFIAKQKKMMNSFLSSQPISPFMKKKTPNTSDGFGNLTRQESQFGCLPTTTKIIIYIYMISYIVPMYYEEKFIGIIGMDFDYTVLAERVHEINIYENGFAHLQIDETVVCSFDSDCEQDTKDNSKYLRVSKELKNGMTLVLSASYDDIRQIRYEIGFEILFVVLVLSAFFTIIAIFVVRKIVAPLKKLADASIKLSNGDYNVDFVNSNVSEIELLNTAFENMASSLHEREKELRFIANRDSLTGLRNTTSYKGWVAEFDKEIANKTANFGIAVFDLNQLKKTNDTYGHDVGDKLIATAAKVISDIFKRSPVFRIGGDEFLAILRHRDLEDCEKLFAQFDLECAKARIKGNGEKTISIARGFALFESDKDFCFNDVFKRADNAMYENKRKIKKAQ